MKGKLTVNSWESLHRKNIINHHQHLQVFGGKYKNNIGISPLAFKFSIHNNYPVNMYMRVHKYNLIKFQLKFSKTFNKIFESAILIARFWTVSHLYTYQQLITLIHFLPK